MCQYITPPSVTGFREPPRKPAWLQGIPYTTTMSSLWSYGVFVPKYPAWMGVPLRIWGFASTIRTLPNMVCGLLEQAHKSLYLPLRSLALFPVLWITLRTYRTTVLSYLDNYIRLLSEFQVFAGRITQYHFTTIYIYVCSLEAPETNCPPFRVTAGFATSIGARTPTTPRGC